MTYLLWRTLIDKKWSVLGWSIGVISIALLTIVFFPSIRDSGGLDKLSSSVPDEMKGIIGDAQSWNKIENYISQQVLNLRVPMVILVFAVMAAIGISVGEEDRRQLKSLQSLPISRASVYFAKWGSLVAMMLMVSLAGGIGVLIGVAMIGESLDSQRLAGAILMLGLLAVAVTSITYAFAMSTGRKSLTTLVASVFVVGNLLIPPMAEAIDALVPFEKFFPYYYYSSPALITEPISITHLLILVAISLVATILGAFLYQKRDIST